MPLYLYGQSALDVARYLRVIEGGTLPGLSSRPRRLSNAIHTHRQLNELNHPAQLMLNHVCGPIHALAPTQDHLNRSDRMVTHLRTHDIPGGAYLDLGNDVFLPTPAFLLLQMATQLDEVGLISLGLELCGYYSKWKSADASSLRSADDETDGCTFELEPATTAKKLMRFVGRCKGERGYRASINALRWILNNSASPMESATYLLLCLPRRMGGYALPQPLFNVKVNVSTSTTTTRRFPDLYWPSHGLDVEYDSDRDHWGLWSRYRDARRTVELVAEKVTVLPLTRMQLMDVTEFHAFATSVRRTLGIRSRTPRPKWYDRRTELRERLLGPQQS